MGSLPVSCVDSVCQLDFGAGSTRMPRSGAAPRRRRRSGCGRMVRIRSAMVVCFFEFAFQCVGFSLFAVNPSTDQRSLNRNLKEQILQSGSDAEKRCSNPHPSRPYSESKIHNVERRKLLLYAASSVAISIPTIADAEGLAARLRSEVTDNIHKDNI